MGAGARETCSRGPPMTTSRRGVPVSHGVRSGRGRRRRDRAADHLRGRARVRAVRRPGVGRPGVGCARPGRRRHGIAPAGYRALDSLRIEKGYRYMGTDLTAADTPYEAGLGVLRRARQGPVQRPRRAGRRRARARAADPHPAGRRPPVPQPLRRRGGARGRVGRRARAELRVRPHGRPEHPYAYLPAEIGPGTTGVQVEVLGQLVDAEVAEDVLYDPDHLRVLT